LYFGPDWLPTNAAVQEEVNIFYIIFICQKVFYLKFTNYVVTVRGVFYLHKIMLFISYTIIEQFTCPVKATLFTTYSITVNYIYLPQGLTILDKRPSSLQSVV
jgi:hypothetical protein